MGSPRRPRFPVGPRNYGDHHGHAIGERFMPHTSGWGGCCVCAAVPNAVGGVSRWGSAGAGFTVWGVRTLRAAQHRHATDRPVEVILASGRGEMAFPVYRARPRWSAADVHRWAVPSR